jgi:hypothetical protein
MAQKDDFEIYPWKFEDDAKLSQCVVVKSVTSVRAKPTRPGFKARREDILY